MFPQIKLRTRRRDAIGSSNTLVPWPDAGRRGTCWGRKAGREISHSSIGRGIFPLSLHSLAEEICRRSKAVVLIFVLEADAARKGCASVPRKGALRR